MSFKVQLRTDSQQPTANKMTARDQNIALELKKRIEELESRNTGQE